MHSKSARSIFNQRCLIECLAHLACNRKVEVLSQTGLKILHLCLPKYPYVYENVRETKHKTRCQLNAFNHKLSERFNRCEERVHKPVKRETYYNTFDCISKDQTCDDRPWVLPATAVSKINIISLIFELQYDKDSHTQMHLGFV